MDNKALIVVKLRVSWLLSSLDDLDPVGKS